MTKVDKITFWIIELLIIVLVLAIAYHAWDMCRELPENYIVTTHGDMTWLIRIYRNLFETIMLLILVGTIMNITALYSAKLKSFKESSVTGKLFFRLTAAVIGFIFVYFIIGLIHVIIR